MNIIFVKWGTKYSSDDVNFLYHSIINSVGLCYPLNQKFFCYTDNPSGLNKDIQTIDILKDPPLRGIWNKLRMFEKDFPLTGKTIYMDLDVYVRIKFNPKELWDSVVDWDNLTMVDSWFKKDFIPVTRKHHLDVTVNSSLLAWDADNPKIHNIWEHFNSTKRDYFLRKYVGIDRYIIHEGFKINTFPRELIQSWYNDKNGKAPIVTFEEVDYASSSVKSWIESDKLALQRIYV